MWVLLCSTRSLEGLCRQPVNNTRHAPSKTTDAPLQGCNISAPTATFPFWYSWSPNQHPSITSWPGSRTCTGLFFLGACFHDRFSGEQTAEDVVHRFDMHRDSVHHLRTRRRLTICVQCQPHVHTHLELENETCQVVHIQRLPPAAHQ